MKRLCLLRGVVDLLADINKIPNMILVGIVDAQRREFPFACCLESCPFALDNDTSPR